MNSDLIAIAEKRGALRARIAMQRDMVAENIWPVEGALDVADRVVEGVHWLQQHPRVLVAALLGLIITRPRRVIRAAGPAWRYGRRGFLYWQTFQRVRKKLQGFA